MNCKRVLQLLWPKLNSVIIVRCVSTVQNPMIDQIKLNTKYVKRVFKVNFRLMFGIFYLGVLFACSDIDPDDNVFKVVSTPRLTDNITATSSNSVVRKTTSTLYVSKSSKPAPVFEAPSIILPTPIINVGTPTPLPGDRVERLLRSVQLRTSALRDLSKKESFNLELVDREKFRDVLMEIFEEDRQKINNNEAIYRAMGIISPQNSLIELLLSLYTVGGLGLYRWEDNTVYLVADTETFEPVNERTYVHEFVHVLQQQNFDIQATYESIKGNSDALLAFRALVEGDARMTEMNYLYQNMTIEERQQSEGTPDPDLVKVFRSAPYVVQREYVFPYREGGNFVASLYRDFGWKSIDGAFFNVPQSTEQILHPDKYINAESPIAVHLPDFLERLGPGWTVVEKDTLGELFFQSYLMTGGSIDEGRQAAAGWGGDSYVLLKNIDSSGLLIISIVWDTLNDAIEFYDLFLSLTQNRTDGKLEFLGENSNLARIFLDQEASIAVKLKDEETVIIFAPSNQVFSTAISFFE